MKATSPIAMRLLRCAAALAALAAVLLAPAACALADTFNWNVASGDFSQGSNWDLGFAPQSGDTAVIANSGACTLSTDYSAVPAAVWLGNGASTAGTLTIASGGSLDSGGVVLGQDGGRGTLVLGGGTLSVPSVANGSSGVGILYFDAGTLEASAGGSQLASGLTAAYIRAGGATIDTNGYNVILLEPLASDPALAPRTTAA